MKSNGATFLTAVTLLVAMCASGALAATNYKVLYNFNNWNGGGFGPEASLVFDSHGNLYSTTTAGGTACEPPGCGVVFELTPNLDGSWSESVLHSFDRNDGSQPHAAVVFDRRGNLYGATVNDGRGGNGTVFELTPGINGAWTEFVVHSFTGDPDGAQPYAGVTLDNAGHLYGTTSAGGADSYGVVFAMGGPGIPGPAVLHSFAGGSDGEQSFGSLVADAGGNLYGVTWGGGANNGTVFEMTRNPVSGTWSETVLHEFRGMPADGANPYAGMIFDAAGNLYGTTYAGGASGFGTVFKVTPNPDGSWSETVLHSFAGGNDGGNPYGGVTLDSLGNLYGTTNAGGAGRHGTIFKMTPMPSGQWLETVLYGFTGGVDGGWPGAGVILDNAGNLYGTAVMGGTGGPEQGGVVFELTP
jgi:uncharacterized repeat protein (TIGR03803 family)